MPRRSIGTGYRQRFDILPSQSLAGSQDSEISRSFKALVARAAREGQEIASPGVSGGAELDNLVTNQGDPYIENDQVGWDPPAELDPLIVEYLQSSIRKLNNYLKEGKLIYKDGDIRPQEAPQEA